MFAAIGYPLTELSRLGIGCVELGIGCVELGESLSPGEFSRLILQVDKERNQWPAAHDRAVLRESIRMFAAIGYPLTELSRLGIGCVELGIGCVELGESLAPVNFAG